MNRIGYVETTGRRRGGRRSDESSFYGQALGWTFEDWGPTYAAFSAGVAGRREWRGGASDGGLRW